MVPLPSSSPRVPTTLMVTPDDQTILSVIRLLLDRCGLSQTEIGRRTGTSQEAISFYRRGRVKRPSIQWLARLAAVCGASLYIEFPQQPLGAFENPPLPKWGYRRDQP